jgi:hypothetical protein
MNHKTYNYFCEEVGIRGIETTIKVIQLNVSNNWKVA